MSEDPSNERMHSITRSSLEHSVNEASPMPMAELEAGTHIILYVNPAFCMFTGKSEEELVGSDISDAAAFGKEFLSLFQKVCRTRRSESHTGEENVASLFPFWSYVMWPVTAEDTLKIVLQVTETTAFH